MRSFFSRPSPYIHGFLPNILPRTPLPASPFFKEMGAGHRHSYILANECWAEDLSPPSIFTSHGRIFHGCPLFSGLCYTSFLRLIHFGFLTLGSDYGEVLCPLAGFLSPPRASSSLPRVFEFFYTPSPPLLPVPPPHTPSTLPFDLFFGQSAPYPPQIVPPEPFFLTFPPF